MNTKKILLLVVVFLFVSIAIINSQVSISYYNANVSKVGVAYAFGNRLNAEMRVYATGDYDEITPEVVVTYNYIKKPDYSLYLGMGTSYNLLNSLAFPLGLQFEPFSSSHRFSLHFELQPTFDYDAGDYFLTSYWGMRYKIW